MRYPLIGLTTYNQANRYGFPISSLMHKYTLAIQEAGGLPLLIPTGMSEEMLLGLFTRLDGILFTGGGDVDPRYYGAQNHTKVTGVDRERDSSEIALAKAAVGTGKPFLGICRGLQLITVGRKEPCGGGIDAVVNK